MTTFDDRKKGYESKFAHDAEMRFKAEARRNRMLGHWAAELMGLSGDKAEEYAKSVIMADFEEAGDDDVLRKVRADLEAAKVPQSDAEIRAKMDEFFGQAVEQLSRQG